MAPFWILRYLLNYYFFFVNSSSYKLYLTKQFSPVNYFYINQKMMVRGEKLFIILIRGILGYFSQKNNKRIYIFIYFTHLRQLKVVSFILFRVLFKFVQRPTSKVSASLFFGPDKQMGRNFRKAGFALFNKI